MSECVTVARPYGKAAFDFAIEHQSLNRWQKMLAFSALITRNEQISELLSGAVAAETISNIFIAICGDKLDKYGQNFIHIMAENRRLQVLPVVLQQFIKLRASLESIIEVDVISASALSDEQQDKIIAAMGKRLKRTVKLNCKIDKSVLAGIIVHAGDIVIDGSVRGRLERLTDFL
ncbi:MAG: F0F1 ATP synthase subunit delta [Serratia symbiotica]|nr:F0F1 ATP synthase subunit delta [Serratia symbiotica]